MDPATDSSLNRYALRHRSHGYVVAVASSGAALLTTLILAPSFDTAPYLLTLGAVIISSWMGGLGPGLLATALGLTGTGVFIVAPRYSNNADYSLIVQLGAFALIAALASSLHSWRIRASERERDRLLGRLRERVKELTLLHRASRVLQKEGDTRTLLQEFIQLLPEGWQYPEIAAARVVFGDIEVITPNFVATAWKQRAEFRTPSGESGAVEVVYVKHPPPSAERPFLEEEESLIESVAVLLGSHFGRMQREQERLELARAQAARSEAEASDRRKDAFLAMVSHELRRPLTAILGWTRMLRQGAAVDFAHGLEVIERSASSQLRLIEELLDVSRISVGQLTLKSSPFDLNEIVSRVCDTLAPAAADRHLELTATLVADGAVVLGDPLRLQQIFGNLVGNAIKFTPSGGRVAVTVENAGKVARVQIADTGIGIDPELVPRIFDPFWKAETSASASTGGLGLGLAIVHRLVKLHGGTIEARSKGSGQGTSMIVALPVVTPASPHATEVAGVSAQPAPQREKRPRLGSQVQPAHPQVD
jgi:signal transduction histidine kinase